MNTLTFKVSGNRLKLVSGYKPVSGEKKYSKLKFIFDDEWKDVESVLVTQFFDVTKVPAPIHVAITDRVAVADIHEDLRNQSGILHIGVVGAIADGSETVIDTNIIHVPVGEGVHLNGTESTALVQQLIEYLASIESNLLTKEGLVKTEHIADGAVTEDGLADRAVTPLKMDRTYWPYTDTLIRSYGDLDLLIENAELNMKLCRVDFSGLFEGKGIIGDGSCLAITDSIREELILCNISTGKSWKYTIGTETLEDITEKSDLSREDIPTYWQDYLDEKIETINSLQNAGGKDSFSFIVITDLHYEQNSGKLSPYLAKKIADSCGIKYILMLGDCGTRNGILHNLEYIDGEWDSIEKMLTSIRDRLLITDGNHDGSYGAIDGDGDGVVDTVTGSGNSAFNFTPEKKYSLIKRKVSLIPDVVFDDNNCGYYADDKNAKVRYIVLSTHNNKYEENEDGSSKYSNMNYFRYGQSQFDLVVNALNTLEDGWNVVVASHVPLDRSGELLHWGATEMEDNRLASGEVECWVMADLLNAYVNRTTYVGSFSGTQGGTVTYKNLANKTNSDWLTDTRTTSEGVSAENGFEVSNFIGDGVTPVGNMTLYYKNVTVSNQRILFYNANKEVVYSVYPTTFSDYEGFDGSATEGRLFIDKEKQNVLSTTAVYVRLCLVSGDTAPIITLDEPIEVSGEAFDAVSVDVDFTNAKGTLIGYFGGHVHKDGAWDNTYTWDGRLKQCDFWTIATRCDSKNENSSELLNERIPGTITEQSFDVFTVDTNNNTIYATKIGAGADRVFKYNKGLPSEDKPSSDFATKEYVDGKIGDFDKALDELHTYAQALIAGGASV